jgi:hypothetical protein
MTIHVFGDDRLPAGLPYDGQRSFAHFFALKRMSIWISAMMIHVFIDNWLPTGLPYDGQRFVWTFLFLFPRASKLDASPQKFHVFVNDSRRPRSRQDDS